MPKTIHFDSNIYDHLDSDPETRSILSSLVHRGSIRIIATPKVVDELNDSPFCGLPEWFPIEVLPESVFACSAYLSDYAT